MPCTHRCQTSMEYQDQTSEFTLPRLLPFLCFFKLHKNQLHSIKAATVRALPSLGSRRDLATSPLHPFRSAIHAVGRHPSQNNLVLPRSTGVEQPTFVLQFQLMTGKPQDHKDLGKDREELKKGGWEKMKYPKQRRNGANKKSLLITLLWLSQMGVSAVFTPVSTHLRSSHPQLVAFFFLNPCMTIKSFTSLFGGGRGAPQKTSAIFLASVCMTGKHQFD